jgi:two-component system NtrC family response regulator
VDSTRITAPNRNDFMKANDTTHDTRTTPWSVLVVEDDMTTSSLICAVLENRGIPSLPCHSVNESGEAMRDNISIGAAVIDLGLPDGDGIDVIRKARQMYPGLPFFVLTAHDSVESAVVAMKAGATDYFTKPFDTEKLGTVLADAVSLYRGQRERNQAAHEGFPSVRRWQSPKMGQALEVAKLAARTLSPVMITGEPSTGKRSFAKLIHEGGRRANKPLVQINLANLTPLEAEIELFGRPLSNTGAAGQMARGRLDRCAGSTVFIENIELLSTPAQSALLEWIVSVDKGGPGGDAPCRLITSGSASMQRLVLEGAFRDELRYALAVYHVEVPSLVERPQDLPDLCEDTITRICVSRKLRRPSLTRRAMEMILDHSWPGNLSELHSVLEHAVTHTGDGLIGPADLPRLLSSAESTRTSFIPLGISSIDDINKATLLAALDACGGNRRRAAQRLKVSLRTIYNMINRYQSDETVPCGRAKGLSLKQPRANAS